MARYLGNSEWLEVDQQTVAIGALGSQSPVAVMPLTALGAVNLIPTNDGGVLVMEFSAANQPAARLAVTFGQAVAASFAALYQWLCQVLNITRKLDSRALSDLVVHVHDLSLRFVCGDDAAFGQLADDVLVLQAHMRPAKLAERLWPVLASAIEVAYKDELIGADEEARLGRLVDVLGLTWADAHKLIPQEWETMVVGRINDGRLPELDTTDVPLVVKPGEVIHGNYAVALMRQQAKTEFRGGSGGVSIPLGHGLRLRTGQVRGQTVNLGTELVVQDTGHLVITSLRTVYVGASRTLEFAYRKLISLSQYVDGLALGVTNRQTTSLFRFSDNQLPIVAAAMITKLAGAVDK